MEKYITKNGIKYELRGEWVHMRTINKRNFLKSLAIAITSLLIIEFKICFLFTKLWNFYGISCFEMSKLEANLEVSILELYYSAKS